jgi:hypothetical protein
MYEVIGITLISWGVGFLAGAALFYPIGRRHGIEVMAEHWRTFNREKARGVFQLNDDPVRGAVAVAHRNLKGDDGQ